ncbi:MAG: hypothetical protein EAZ15_03550 [Sphingobacteriales bacterium]|nr:MAG: hypothetical protein EAZ15_03550 [Sphingobacteriales bacterium]
MSYRRWKEVFQSCCASEGFKPLPVVKSLKKGVLETLRCTHIDSRFLVTLNVVKSLKNGCSEIPRFALNDRRCTQSDRRCTKRDPLKPHIYRCHKIGFGLWVIKVFGNQSSL